MNVRWKKYTLKFYFDAGTSRGVLKTKDTWFIRIAHEGRFGMGEAGPLRGLSMDDRPDFEEKLNEVCRTAGTMQIEALKTIDWREVFELHAFPSIVFAFEMAVLDWFNGGRRILFGSAFTEGKSGIPINGLIWMGSKDFMKEQIDRKLEEGFSCIKMKIGALDFDTEFSLLEMIRSQFGPDKITLRVDANGAFSPDEAEDKLQRLTTLRLHSIEQPVKAGQVDVMRQLCEKAFLPVALDEELIGVQDKQAKKALLENIKPPFIILKPTLLGGFSETTEWITLAESMGIGWWITSALESNIGLNAIAQFTASLDTKNLPQGLGTGQLYTNNLESPMVIKTGSLYFFPQVPWDLKGLF